MSKKQWLILAVLGIGNCAVLALLGVLVIPDSISPRELVATTVVYTSPTPTPTPIESTLSLQMGFSDEHVVWADSEGFSLSAIRTSEISGQPYAAFYLSRDYEPRVLNDFATLILAYEGEPESIGGFVHRIEIREPLDPELVSSLPSSTGLSTSLSFSNNVITGYEAAGFSLRATRTSTDARGTEYYAAAVYLDDLYHILTFEYQAGSSEYLFLEPFPFPELPPKGAELSSYYSSQEEFLGAGFDCTFDEAWAAALPDFTPESKMEKALYALGCSFSKGEDFWMGGEHGRFGEEQLYHGKRYLLYSCTLLSNPNQDEWAAFQFNNFVSVFALDGQYYERLWSSLYWKSTYSRWGDINQDQMPDLVVNKVASSDGIGPAAFTGGYNEGQDVLQLTSSGDVIDLLFGVNQSRVSGDFSGIGFADLDGDGVAEIVADESVSMLFGACHQCTTWWNATTRIYHLEDDFYYLPTRTGYEFLCQQDIDHLIAREREGTFFPDQSAAIDHVYHALATLVTCDTVGMRQKGWETFQSEASIEKYSIGCREWLSAVHQHLDTIYQSGGRFTFDALPGLGHPDNWPYWNSLFNKAVEQGCDWSTSP